MRQRCWCCSKNVADRIMPVRDGNIYLCEDCYKTWYDGAVFERTPSLKELLDQEDDPEDNEEYEIEQEQIWSSTRDFI
jgi:hypothetical protein